MSLRPASEGKHSPPQSIQNQPVLLPALFGRIRIQPEGAAAPLQRHEERGHIKSADESLLIWVEVLPNVAELLQFLRMRAESETGGDGPGGSHKGMGKGGWAEFH